MGRRPEKSAPRASASGRPHSPTRETLLRMLEAQSRPTSTAALVEATGWHENTVRGHLQALWQDGYLTRSRDERAAGPGRPSWLWEPMRRDVMAPYAHLASALAERLAATSKAPAAEAREAGRAWGRALGVSLPPATDGEAARRTVIDVMRNRGFAPRAEEPPLVRLLRCPLLEAAVRHPDVVCAVHLGMISGVLEAIGSADQGSELEPFSGPGECTLRLRIAP